MTRKSHKGIVGKQIPTLHTRYEVGEGLSFTEEELRTSRDIEDELDRRDNDRE